MIIDPVCVFHGKKWSEHYCLYCCMCFKTMEIEECSLDESGKKQDVCKTCNELFNINKGDKNVEKRLIEINGVKLEVDLRQAIQVEKYSIGDRIKILMKEYSNSYTSYPGMIVGFDNFVNSPTVIIAYLSQNYGSCADIKFCYFNSKTENVELAPAHDFELAVSKFNFVESVDEEIKKKFRELEDLKRRKEFFLKNFQKHFEQVDQQ